jgi:hypothetical protein
VSQISQPAVYVASIAIHVSGILLLLQYLFLRPSFKTQSPSGRLREIEDAELLRRQNTNRQSTTSMQSIQSDEYTRKRRSRPHSTSGDYLRRESGNFSWDSLPATLVDRTASGRKIPPRSPNFDGAGVDRPKTAEQPKMLERPKTSERPKTAERPKSGEKLQVNTDIPSLRRWHSYSADVHPSLMDNEPLVPLKEAIQEQDGEVQPPPISTSRKLRRRIDHIPSKPDLSELLNDGSGVAEPPSDSLEVVSKRESSGSQSSSRPVLLPPLLDPMISRSALQKQEAASRPSTSRDPSEPTPSGSIPRPFFNTLPESTILPTPSSTFVFPFHHASEPHTETSTQPLPHDPTPVSDSLTNLIQHPYSWSLRLDDLLQPDPPFAAEDHFYLCSPTSESRLSTITEEGTIRSVATPPNIIISDTPTLRASPSVVMRTITPLSGNTASWYAQGGAQYDVDRAMNQLGKSPSPEGGGRKE